MADGHLCSQNSTTIKTDVVSARYWDKQVFCLYSLCSAEGHLKVLPAVAGAQGVVVKGFRKEIVHQCTKCHAIAPAG